MLLSLIIPTRNRAQSLSDLLDSLKQLEPVSFQWEVIVVDNGSTDATPEVVAQKQAELTYSIRYVLEERPGLHQGRHRGAREARGEILAYLDDDILFTPTWFAGAAAIARGDADIIAGRVLPRWQAQPPALIQSFFSDGVCSPLSLLDLGDQVRPVAAEFVFGCNFVIRKQLVFEAGGFHPDGMPQDLLRYRGDGETALMGKLAQQGANMLYHPLAAVYHVISPERLTLDYMCKRAYMQGISDLFSQLRAEAGLIGYMPHAALNPFQRLLRRSPREVAQILARKLVVRFVKPDPAFRDVHAQVAAAHRAGWEFHRRAVAEDAALRAYVLQPSFLKSVLAPKDLT